MNVIKWVATKRGKYSPVNNGYHFQTKGGKSGRQYWICNRCPVRLVTEGRHFYSITGEHDHLPNQEIPGKKAFDKKIEKSSKDVVLSQEEVSETSEGEKREA